MVLYGGKRRRRLGKPFLALGVLVALGVGLAVWQLWPSSGSTEVSVAAVKDPVPVSKKPRAARSAPAPPLLTVRRPLARGIRIAAQAGVLLDAGSGTVLWAKHPHERVPIASTTKIMTAILAMQRLRPSEVVVVDRSVPRVQPFKEGLRAGEHVPAWKLYYGLLLYSGNDDALALAIAAGGTRAHFIALMNEKASQLDMHDTHFRSTSGIVDRGNYSSAWDMAALARYAMWNRLFRKVVRTHVKRVSWAPPTYSKIYVNHNHLLGSYPGADGVKTGWTTRAKHCLVASAHRGSVRLIAVALGSPDAYPDVRKLLNYGFATRG
jgi:serine-type D-Ala-D-Ala carboxypeptidase (penicillin-binding protein 5/6)